MRWIAWALLLAAGIHSPDKREPSSGRVIEVSTAAELMDVFREPLENVTVKLAAGTYALTHWTVLTISGKRVRLVGDHTGVAITNQGIRFKNCEECAVERLTVAGTPWSSGGAIAVSNSSVRIANCVISANASAGIRASEAVDLTVEFNELLGHGEAIVLSGDARADIRNNFIEHLDSLGANGIVIKNTAMATVERNHIRRCGILMGNRADVVCVANVIEEGRGGIVAESEHALRAVIEDNVVFRCGTGIRLAGNGIAGKATQNMIVESGDPVSTREVTSDITIRDNTFYGNEIESEAYPNAAREMFWRERRPWTRTYRNTPVGVDGRHKFHESAFLTRYGRWLN